jgi:hypothetical protein
MDHRWSQEWRKDYDNEAHQLWLDMEQRVWREARIFSGMELSPPEPDASDDIDVLTDEEMDDIGQLGDEDPPLPMPSPRRLVGTSNKHKCG